MKRRARNRWRRLLERVGLRKPAPAPPPESLAFVRNQTVFRWQRVVNNQVLDTVPEIWLQQTVDDFRRELFEYVSPQGTRTKTRNTWVAL